MKTNIASCGLLAAVGLLAACTSPLPKAAETAADSLKKGTSVVSDLRSSALTAYRMEVLLNPSGSGKPEELVKSAVCSHFDNYPLLVNLGVAEDELSAAGAALPKLAAAPKGDGLVVQIRAINKHNQDIAKYQSSTDDGINEGEAKQALIDERKHCEADVLAAIKQAQSAKPFSYDLPESKSFTAIIGAIMAAKQVSTEIAGMVEEQRRASAIKAYVRAHKKALLQSADVISGKGTPGTAAGGLATLGMDVEVHHIKLALLHARYIAASNAAKPGAAKDDDARLMHAERLLAAVAGYEAVHGLDLANPKKSVGKGFSDAVNELVKASESQGELSWENLEALIDAASRLDKTYQDFDEAKGKIRDAF